MTRKIPWRDGATVKASSRANSTMPSSTLTPPRRPTAEAKGSGEEDVKATVASLVNRRVKRLSLKRSRSSSPPPEPLEESFMREGLDGDDMYRMVEDEFYYTAQRFTAHLHAAEYQKLKDKAKSHNAATIRDITRPVVGQVSDLVQKKLDRAARLKQQKLVKRVTADDEDTEEDDTYHKGTSLFGLMQSPRKKIPRLDHFDPSTSTSGRNLATSSLSKHTSTRASHVRPPPLPNRAPGQSDRQPSRYKAIVQLDAEDEDENLDLDTPPRSKPFVASNRPPTASIPRTTADMDDRRKTLATGPHKPAVLPPRRKSPKPSSSGPDAHDAAQSTDDESDGALFGFQKRARERSLARTKGYAQTSKKDDSGASKDFIPGFI
ncbi:hypothetical protein JX265_011191 [Neoarthrinium moseri]|uniref:Uncharacterized protein n=1 Tax=Neoarthrinium moseri TaxID=1658444 RepID=A0A9Q0AKS8_9PEZI|nr:uncharacterized protein JN550_010495 [Neoarthrinium moseri]KAI1857456.1 hypothetical protein JX265_011191 [Neoarthrinium moseri]KAI1862030.1 hypothetical protein JN550_010495 [Neoarthrinium moseri]